MFYVVGYPVSPASPTADGRTDKPHYSIIGAKELHSPDPLTGYLPIPIFPPFELETDAVEALKNLQVSPYSPLHPWMGVINSEENYVPS